MKKYFFIFLFALPFASPIKAELSDKQSAIQKTKVETSDQEGCFDENTHIINVGVGFGGGNYYKGGRGRGSAYRYRISPAFSLSYEQAWKPKLGPGYLGVGAYVGYQYSSFRYNYNYSNYYYNGGYYNGAYYYQHNWNYIMVAARAAYHWDVLNSKKAELYAGVLIGVRIQTYSYSTNDVSPKANDYRLNENSVYPAGSVFAGARWYFAPKFALYGEVGYGISYITGGISFKF